MRVMFCISNIPFFLVMLVECSHIAGAKEKDPALPATSFQTTSTINGLDFYYRVNANEGILLLLPHAFRWKIFNESLVAPFSCWKSKLWLRFFLYENIFCLNMRKILIHFIFSSFWTPYMRCTFYNSIELWTWALLALLKTQKEGKKHSFPSFLGSMNYKRWRFSVFPKEEVNTSIPCMPLLRKENVQDSSSFTEIKGNKWYQ